MSDFLRNLIGRELGAQTGLRPRLPFLFERDAPAMDPIDGSDVIEAPAAAPEAPTQSMPWRRLRSDTPTAAEAGPTSAPTPAHARASAQDPLPLRARTRAADTPAHDEPPSAAKAPRRERRNAAQRSSAAPVEEDIAIAAPHRAQAQRTIAIQAQPSPSAATPRSGAAPQREPAAFVPRAPSLAASAPVSSQRTRIAPAEADGSGSSKTSPATEDGRHVAARMHISQPAPVQALMPTAMPLRPRVSAQASAAATPADTARETVIQVSIGRIEVRAAPQPRAGATDGNGSKREAPRPTALEDYLRERQGKRGA